jgi:hypothetical protein
MVIFQKRKNRESTLEELSRKKRSREGSNLRPTDPQSVALSTELRDREWASRAAPDCFGGFRPPLVCRSIPLSLSFHLQDFSTSRRYCQAC